MKKQLSKIAILLVITMCLPLLAACDVSQFIGFQPTPPANDGKVEDKTEAKDDDVQDDELPKGMQMALGSDNNSYRVSSYKGTEANLVIPETYNGFPVTEIDENAFLGNKKLVSVVIPDSVEIIGNSAFKNCQRLEYVTIGEYASMLCEIGKQAFFGCTTLEFIEFVGDEYTWDSVEKGKDWDKNAGMKTDDKKYEVVFIETSERPTEAPEVPTEKPSEDIYTDFVTEEVSKEETATSVIETAYPETAPTFTETETEPETEIEAETVPEEWFEDYNGISIVTKPINNVPYKLYFNQVIAGKILYLDGGMNGRYLTTTDDPSKAIDIYAYNTDGGCMFLFYSGYEKFHIEAYVNTDGKLALRYSDNPSIWYYNAETHAWTTTLNGEEYFIGTYNTFETVSISRSSYITAENTRVKQFPLELMKPVTAGECNHYFFNKCDTVCKLCGAEREIRHFNRDGDMRCDLCEYYLNHLCSNDMMDDNYCDICGSVLDHKCIDMDGDAFCEFCGIDVRHVCSDIIICNGMCDECGKVVAHTCVDFDGNLSCDICGNLMNPETHRHKLVDYPHKNPSCNEDGHEHYSVCSDCGKILNMYGMELDAIPVLPAGHKFSHRSSNGPYCYGGNEEYYVCEYCNGLFDMEKNPIDEIPTVAPDPDNHPWGLEEAVPPTLGHDGHESYYFCKACGILADMDFNLIDEIPYISISREGCEVFFDAKALNTLQLNGMSGSYFISHLSEDHSYNRFAREGQSFDGNIMLISENPDLRATGQYLIFKYRTSSETNMQIWANTIINSHDSGKANIYYSLTADEEWHIAIIDLSKLLPKYVALNGNGEYAIQWARLDILDKQATEGYIDLAWIAYCNDPSDILFAITEEDQANCDHSIDYIYNPEASLYEGVCTLCGYYDAKDLLYVTEAATTGYNSSYISASVISDAETGKVYTRYDVIDNKDPYFYLITGNKTVVTGQYMVVKYRLHNEGKNSALSIGFAATAPSGYTSARGQGDRLAGNLGTLIGDGEWHYVVIDLYSANQSAVGSSTSVSPAFIPDENGEYITSFVRLKFNATQLSDGTFTALDVDYVGFADNMDVINNHIANN